MASNISLSWKKDRLHGVGVVLLLGYRWPSLNHCFGIVELDCRLRLQTMVRLSIPILTTDAMAVSEKRLSKLTVFVLLSCFLFTRYARPRCDDKGGISLWFQCDLTLKSHKVGLESM